MSGVGWTRWWWFSLMVGVVCVQVSPRCSPWQLSTHIWGRPCPRSPMWRPLTCTWWAASCSSSSPCWSMLLSTTSSSGGGPSDRRRRRKKLPWPTTRRWDLTPTRYCLCLSRYTHAHTHTCANTHVHMLKHRYSNFLKLSLTVTVSLPGWRFLMVAPQHWIHSWLYSFFNVISAVPLVQ